MRVRRSPNRPMVALAIAVLSLLSVGGIASASGDPPVVAAFRDGPVSIHGGGTFGTVLSLNVPKGRWLVSARAGVTSASSPDRTATCRLEAGSDRDTVQARNGDLGFTGGSTVLSLIVAHEFGSAGHARLRCTSNGATGADHVSDLRVSALKVGTLTRIVIGRSASTSGSGSPRVVSAARDASRTVPGDDIYHAIASIPVPSGSWVVLGKAQVRSGSSGDSVVDCELFAGSDIDDALLSVIGSADRAPVGLTTEHHFTAAGHASIACRSTASFHVSSVRLAAVGAGTLTRTALGGATHSSGSAPPRVVYGFTDGPVAVPGGGALSSVGSVTLPAGNWTVRATLFLDDFEGVPLATTNVKCQLTLGADTDQVVVEFDPSLGVPDLPITLQDVHHFSSDGVASVDCGHKGSIGTVHAHFLRIVAIRAGSLTDTAS